RRSATAANVGLEWELSPSYGEKFGFGTRLITHHHAGGWNDPQLACLTPTRSQSWSRPDRQRRRGGLVALGVRRLTVRPLGGRHCAPNCVAWGTRRKAERGKPAQERPQAVNAGLAYLFFSM